MTKFGGQLGPSGITLSGPCNLMTARLHKFGRLPRSLRRSKYGPKEREAADSRSVLGAALQNSSEISVRRICMFDDVPSLRPSGRIFLGIRRILDVAYLL